MTADQVITIGDATRMLLNDLSHMLPNCILRPNVKEHATVVSLHDARGHFASVRLSKVAGAIRLQSWIATVSSFQPLFEDSIPMNYGSYDDALVTLLEKLHAKLPKPPRLVAREPDPHRLLHETVEDAVHAT